MTVPMEERLILFDFDDEEDDTNVLEKALSEEKNPAFDKDENKSPPIEADEDMGDEIHSMLHKFGENVNNSLLEKRRRIQMYSQMISKESSYKMKQVWKTKQKQLLKLNNMYYQQFMDLFKQWDLDKQRFEKQQENLISIFKQQQMVLIQQKIKQNQRMTLIMQMVIQYTQLLTNIKDKSASCLELKKEIAEYQKKQMIETQQLEIANIRKSLLSILF
ncbi:synaptonemal complex protein 3-like [Rattus norvegicus]|uniref:synaptonemal complex protein 3-like n=1 Tax=Rattus norvegicus TaxID=10116 RepID=UPI002FD8305B